MTPLARDNGQPLCAMNDRRGLASVCAGALAFGLLVPQVQAKDFGSWQALSSTDEMDGATTHYVVSESTNVLTGWLERGPVLFGYNCTNDTVYLRANGLGFAADDSESTDDGLRQFQSVRMRFGDGQSETYRFGIWQENDDGMQLVWPLQSATCPSKQCLIENVRSQRRMLVEVKLFNTGGREQVARFNLDGSAKALSWCRKRAD